MNWTVHKPEGKSYITVVTEDDFNLPDHQRMIEDIISRDFWKPGTDAFFDHRKLQFNSTGYYRMKEASEIHQKYEQQIGDGKAAILMKSLADFGRGRQFEMLIDNKASAKLRIFLDEKEALDWLSF